MSVQAGPPTGSRLPLPAHLLSLPTARTFHFTEILEEMQGEIVIAMAPLERSLFVLTCSSFNTRFGTYRLPTEKILRHAAFNGYLELFKTLLDDFDFPLTAFKDLSELIEEASGGPNSLEFLRWITVIAKHSIDNLRTIFRNIARANCHGVIEDVFLSNQTDTLKRRSLAIEAFCSCLSMGNIGMAQQIFDQYDPILGHNVRERAAEAALSSGSLDVIRWLAKLINLDWSVITEITWSELCGVPNPYDLAWIKRSGIEIASSENLLFALKEKNTHLVGHILDKFDPIGGFFPDSDELFSFFAPFSDTSFEPIYTAFLAHPCIAAEIRKKKQFAKFEDVWGKLHLSCAAFEFLLAKDLLSSEYFAQLDGSDDPELLLCAYGNGFPIPPSLIVKAALRIDSAKTILKLLQKCDESSTSLGLSLKNLIKKDALNTATSLYISRLAPFQWTRDEVTTGLVELIFDFNFRRGTGAEELARCFDRWVRWCLAHDLAPLPHQAFNGLNLMSMSRITREWLSTMHGK